MDLHEDVYVLPTDEELRSIREPRRYIVPVALAVRSAGAVAAIAVIQIWIAPRIVSIFEEVGEELPALSQAALRAGYVLNTGTPVFLPLLAIAIGAVGFLPVSGGLRTLFSHTIPLALYMLAVLLTVGYMWPLL